MHARIAALAGGLLSTALVVVPLAGSALANPADAVRCAPPAPHEACAVLDQATRQLAPLTVVLGPAAEAVGLLELPVLAARPQGVSTDLILARTASLQDLLAALPVPLRSAPGVQALSETLDDLTAAVTAPVAGATGPATAGPATPAAPAAAAPEESRADGPSTLGPSASAGASPDAPVDSPAIPNVPVGDSLTFAPLALPDFGFESDFDAAVAPPVAEEAPAAPTELAASVVAEELPRSDGREAAAAVAVVVLLLVGAVVADARKRPHTIAD